MSSSKKFGCSRRNFLKVGSASSLASLSRVPTLALFSALLQGQADKALAQAAGVSPNRFAIFYSSGGVNSSMWQPLNPYGANEVSMVTNQSVGTRFDRQNGRLVADTGLAHETFNFQGVQVPICWSYPIPTTASGNIPMSALLPYQLTMNGVNSGNAGHTAAQALSWIPPGSGQSLSALVGDAGFSSPLASISAIRSNFQWRSNSNLTNVNITAQNNNWVQRLLAAFAEGGLPRNSLEDAYRQILPLIDREALKGNPSAEALMGARDSARNLSGFVDADLQAEWDGLVAKYQSLISGVFALYMQDGTMPGLNDFPVGRGGGESSSLYAINGTTSGSLHNASDLRRMVTAQTSVSLLARSMAFSEYVLTKNLTGTVSTNVGTVGSFTSPVNGDSRGMGNDAHTSGVYIQTIGFLLRHMAQMACYNEFANQLDSAGIGRNTVTSFVSEFSRIVRVAGTGSDHGWRGNHLAVYSRGFQPNGESGAPVAIGNYQNETSGRYLGHWGRGGIVPELGRYIGMADTMSTFAHLLNVPSPITAAETLVTQGPDGRIASNIGRTRIMAIPA